MTRDTIKVRIIEPDQLETRDLLSDPDALECLSRNRAEFLRRADRRLVTSVCCDGSSTIWDYGPSWAVAVLDEGWPVQHTHRTCIQRLLRHAASNKAVRDAVIAAALAGDHLVLRLAQQQRTP